MESSRAPAQAWIGQSPVQSWKADVEAGVGKSLLAQVVIFSDHLAAYPDRETWDWFIIDRRDGGQINLAPFHSDEMNYLALTCYHLRRRDNAGARVHDVVRAEGAASNDMGRCADDPRINHFLADFCVAAVELMDGTPVLGWIEQSLFQSGEAGTTGEPRESLPVPVVFFSDHLVARLEEEGQEWFVYDRRDGRRVNSTPGRSDEFQHFARTCYYLRCWDDAGARAHDVVRAASAASDDLKRGVEDPEINSFLDDFTRIASELLDLRTDLTRENKHV